MSEVDQTPDSISPAALAGAASIAAAAVQMFLAGTVSDHRHAVTVLGLAAAAQLGWGLWAVLRSDRSGALLGAVLQITVVSLWLGAITSGLSFVGGLESRRPIDASVIAAIALSALAGFGALARLVDGRPEHEQSAPATRVLWGTAALASLAVVAASAASTTSPAPVANTGSTVSTPAPATSIAPSGGPIGLPTGGGDIDQELTKLVEQSGATSTSTTSP